MAKKSLGYVELEWTCPTCDTRNPGSRRTCQGCGAPQPPDVEFEAPLQAEIRTDEEAAGGADPDLHCPYCDARNLSTATVCKQCGADLSDAAIRASGDVVEGFTTAGRPPIACAVCGAENPAGQLECQSCGSPLARPEPEPSRLPSSKIKPESASAREGGKGCLWVAAGLALALVVAIGVFIYNANQRTDTQGTVVAAEWTRTVTIEGLAPVEYTAWREEIPADATIGACTDEVRSTSDEPAPGAREVCGTPYAVDQGSGFAEVVQDCEYEILEQRCTYTVNEWRDVDQLVRSGAGFEPAWPDIQISARQRAGDRETRYTCIFRAGDREYRYRAASLDEYLLCEPDSRWSLVVNNNGAVVEALPLE